MDRKYWEKYYDHHSRPEAPSLFAEFILNTHLKTGSRLVELGCGNGRDSIFFAQNGIHVSAVDQVKREIDFLNGTYSREGLNFLAGDFTRLELGGVFDCVYSRFTLHSVSEEDEKRVLKWAHEHLAEGGTFCAEVRSVNDPKLQHGARISHNENTVDGHYRRYFDLTAFKQRLRNQEFQVTFAEERTGFAPHEEEDPPVVRIVARIRNIEDQA